MHAVPVKGLVALSAVAVLGLTPAVPADPVLAASTYYLQGTRIGDFNGHATPLEFDTQMVVGSGGAAPAAGDFQVVDYPASIWPFSHGGLGDPRWNDSVAQGTAHLGDHPIAGDTVFGYSQGAVVATNYKRDHLGNGVNIVLIENPNRPNGGMLARFQGLHIPILDITFNGATPVVQNPGPTTGHTVDIARQYDGWADFPTYPLNLLATVNAILGILYLHGDTQDLRAADIASIDKTDPRYFQQHGDTTYYLIPTQRLPLLMPLRGLLPEQILDVLDAPLRAVVESGYDRTDYSKPTGAQLFPVAREPAAAQTVVGSDVRALGDIDEVADDTALRDDPQPRVTRTASARTPTSELRQRRGTESAADTSRRPHDRSDSHGPKGRNDRSEADSGSDPE